MDLAWKTFNTIANKALQNLVNKCRDDERDKYGDNILEWKDRGVPSIYDWITTNNWPKLCDYWCSDEFARRSHQNCVNRAASNESSFATTVSVNMLVHKQKFVRCFILSKQLSSISVDLNENWYFFCVEMFIHNRRMRTSGSRDGLTSCSYRHISERRRGNLFQRRRKKHK